VPVAQHRLGTIEAPQVAGRVCPPIKPEILNVQVQARVDTLHYGSSANCVTRAVWLVDVLITSCAPDRSDRAGNGTRNWSEFSRAPFRLMRRPAKNVPCSVLVGKYLPSKIQRRQGPRSLCRGIVRRLKLRIRLNGEAKASVSVAAA
jgi:hypothetical protein